MDYYDLLGVEPDAPVSDIRAAYRERKAEVADRDDDDARADAAALNKAWNVLSDPYQRGRYDQQLADADDTDGEYDDDDDDDDVVDAPAGRTRTTRTARANEPGRQKGARPPLVPTVKLPPGVAFPPTRARIIAMVIDLVVLLMLFVASAYATNELEKSRQPEAHRQVSTVLPDRIEEAQDAANEADDRADTAENRAADLTETQGADDPDTQAAQEEADELRAAADRAQAEKEALEDEFTEQTKKLTPIRTTVSGIFFLVALLVLLIPSLFGGQTLGKRLQKIRVAKMDGSNAGFVELLRRYGLMAMAAFVLSLLLQGPIGAVVVVFVATMWTRNPNRQGLQDRFAKTLVVTGQPQEQPVAR
jgi:curved DNA-binding protein CbpA